MAIKTQRNFLRPHTKVVDPGVIKTYGLDINLICLPLCSPDMLLKRCIYSVSMFFEKY